jgi:Xaa-Pro aminopeptidase
VVTGQPSEIGRRERLQAVVRTKELAALLVQAGENRRYLSGFTGSSGWLVVTSERSALITDGRYWTQVKEQCPGLELVRFIPDEHVSLGKRALLWMQEEGISGQVGFESPIMNVSEHSKLVAEAESLKLAIELVPADNLTEHLRQCKDEGELETMGRAARAADRAFMSALEVFKAGIKERDFCVELEYQMAKHGARKPSFDSIVASGPNGAFPHAGVTDRVIGHGELVTVDFGALVDGYCSDTTRTIWIGELPELEQKVYRAVREAHKRALDAIRPGKLGKEIDKVARDIIIEAGFGEAFKHGLGHGVGLAVHEMPTLRSTSDNVLEMGMIVTVEPGIYLPGQTGCRVEDSVLITKDGVEYVTKSPYQELGQHHPLEIQPMS